MGAWGTGPYDNDGAADWAGDLDDAGDVVAFVSKTFEAGDEDDEEYDDASAVIAAAAWLAAGLPGGPPLAGWPGSG